MDRYQFSDTERKTLEKLRAPLAVYQFLNKRVTTLLLSDGFLDLFGLADREKAMYLMDHNMYEMTHPDDKARAADEAIRFATKGGRYDLIYRSRRYTGDEEYRILHSMGEHVFTEDGTRLAYIWYTDEGAFSEENSSQFLVSNEIRRALNEKSAAESGNYDILTGLPTMAHFFDLVNQWRREHRGGNGRASMLYMNLCGMKHYNRKFGFTEGDNLLRRFAGLLDRAFGHENCSRFGSDHFCAFSQAEDIEKILEDIFSDFLTDKAGPSLPVRVGIYPEIQGMLGVSAECDRAKYACDTIQNIRVSGFRYFDKTMLAQAEKRHYYIDNLNKALEDGSLQVYYQPLIRAANGRVCHEEALSRWVDPARGVIPPDEFIPVLEESKLIYKLDLFVVEQILKKITIQQQEGLYVVPMSVNLSRSDFDTCDIVEEIRRRVDAAGVSHSLLNIEITESAVGKDFDYMKKQIERFRELGFRVWMDDFGSGYSSLDMLHSIHFDAIKFDMLFMKQFGVSDKSKILLTELIRMVISLGMDTVCEGVENKEQASFLHEVGCTMMQGYYFCRPITLDQILERYRKGVQIGFENPDESDYYAAIGKVNLYDLTVFSNDDEEAFEHYFNTIPMAILESSAEYYKLVRCNSSYRGFLVKMFGYFPLGKTVNIDEGDGVTGKSFLNAIRECAEMGNKILIEEKLPNGSVIHAFLKSIALNPVTGMRALAVAILKVEKTDKTPVTFTYIAKALSSDYIRLYYVNIRTDKYIEYSSDTVAGELEVARHGDDFFASRRRDARHALFPGDMPLFLNAFTKENILRAIVEEGAFLLSYRLMLGGDPTFVNMKAVHINTDEDHIIIGVTKKNEPTVTNTNVSAAPDGGK